MINLDERDLLDLSSKCAEPACFVSWVYFRMLTPLDPNKFDNCDTLIQEIAFRTFLGLGTLVALSTIIIPVAIITLAVASKVLRAVGFLMQNNNYTHVQGKAEEKTVENQVKVMTWNICGPTGGLHYDHGGVIGWRGRLEGIINQITQADADVLILQEIYDTALAEALINELETRYAHIFMHLGSNVMGSVGGLMVFSKCAPHSFKNSSFMNNKWTLNRTFATLEIKAKPDDQTPCARIIGTHLIHDDNEARKAQIEQIVASIRESVAIPTVLAGDLNLEREDPEQGGMLNPYFAHGYQGDLPTRTNNMLKEWNEKLSDPGDFIDYISLYKEGPGALDNTHIVRAYSDDFNTKTALSDHNGLVGILNL